MTTFAGLDKSKRAFVRSESPSPRRLRMRDLSPVQRRGFVKLWHASQYVLGLLDVERGGAFETPVRKSHAQLWRLMGELLRDAGLQPGQAAPIPWRSKRALSLWASHGGAG